MTTLTLLLDPVLAEQLQTFQAITQEDLQPTLTEIANGAARDLLRQLADRKLWEEESSYINLHPELKKTHLGKYVAIHQGKLIDSDVSQWDLYIRVHQQIPDMPVGIFLVKENADMAVHNSLSSRLLPDLA